MPGIGLVRHARARAHLCDTWYVNSEAAVKLTRGAFEALHAEPGIGRAEALRRAMLGLVGSGSRKQA
jgi:hypothetical protein